MKPTQSNRRKFIKNVAASAASLAILPSLPKTAAATGPNAKIAIEPNQPFVYSGPPRIRFSVIGINHGHINSMVDAVIRGGGEFVAFYAVEQALRDPFAKKYPQAAIAAGEQEILEDKSIQLI